MLTRMAELKSVFPARAEMPLHPAEDDPVVGTIETYRLARSAYDDAAELLAALEARLPAEVARSPRVVLGKVAGPDGIFRDKSAFSHGQIDQWFDRSMKSERNIWGRNFNDEQIRKLRAEAHATLDTDIAEVTRAQEETGFAAATERYRKADAAEFAALEAVCSTTPETIAGAHALLSMLLLDDVFGNSPDLRQLQMQGLRSLQRSLAALAGTVATPHLVRPQRPT